MFRCDSVPEFFYGGNLFDVDCIPHPSSFAPAVHKAAIRQDLHVVGKGRLRDLEGFQYVAGAHFAAGKHLDDLQPRFVGQRLKHRGIFRVGIFHFLYASQFCIKIDMRRFHSNSSILHAHIDECQYVGEKIYKTEPGKLQPWASFSGYPLLFTGDKQR
jgi:hypothetical protein